MGIISRLIGSGDLLLYHDYRSGSLRGFSGNSKHGTATGSPNLQRSGVAFNASTGQYITAGADTLGTGAGTVVVCCKATNYGENGFGRLFDNGAFSIYNVSSTRLQLGFNPFPATPVGSFQLAVDNLVCCSWDASGISNTYINGTNVLPSESIGSPAAGTTFNIGNRTAHDRQFGGLITAVLVINKELTTSEVSEITSEFCNKKWNQKTIFRSAIGSQGLPLDDNVKASYSLPGVTDLTGNGYNGTLNGSPRRFEFQCLRCETWMSSSFAGSIFVIAPTGFRRLTPGESPERGDRPLAMPRSCVKTGD